MDIVLIIKFLMLVISGNLNEWKIDADFAYGSYFFESNQTQNNGIATKFNIKPSTRFVNFH